MLLNLKQIGGAASKAQRTLDFTHKLDLSAVKLWGGYPFMAPVSVSGSVSFSTGIFTINYKADFVITGTCSRCLAPVTRDMSREFEHTILVDSENDETTDSFISAPGAELDLDELVTSDLLLEYGGVMLCSEDCRGICPKCGKNLNEGGCGCDLSEPDPRFDVLRKLLHE